jgi:tetratricopeptide (TPR) repeat protein
MDFNKEIKNFSPIDIEKFSQNKDVSEKVIDSVKLYNKAISYLKSGSEDIAIIELKKVVSINPSFSEAINLLGLCYAYTNQLDKAEELFGRVAKSDNSTLKAADYLNYFNAADTKASKKTSENRNKSTANKSKKIDKEPKKRESYINDNVQSEYYLLKKFGLLLKNPSIAIVLNIISVLCLVTALILFFTSANSSKGIDAGPDTAKSTQVTKSNNDLVAKNKSLTEQLNAANAKLKQMQLSDSISNVSLLYGQGKYEEAADKLMSISGEELNSDLKKQYTSLKSEVLLKAADKLTRDGNALYNSRKYQDAVKKLEKVFTLGDKWTFGDKALYILGKSYVEVNDTQNGAKTYQKLINDYPDSPYVKYAKARLQGIR